MYVVLIMYFLVFGLRFVSFHLLLLLYSTWPAGLEARQNSDFSTPLSDFCCINGRYVLYHYLLSLFLLFTCLGPHGSPCILSCFFILYYFVLVLTLVLWLYCWLLLCDDWYAVSVPICSVMLYGPGICALQLAFFFLLRMHLSCTIPLTSERRSVVDTVGGMLWVHTSGGSGGSVELR